MRTTLFICGTLICWTTLKMACINAVQLKFTNVVCKSHNESWYRVHDCRLRAINRTRTVLNINSTILQPANDITVRIVVLKKANGYKPWLFNTSLDACRFVKKPYNPFGILLFKVLKEFSSFNHTCPYVGPQIINGLYVRLDVLRLPLPTGDYLLETIWSFDKKLTFATNIYFTFVEDM